MFHLCRLHLSFSSACKDYYLPAHVAPHVDLVMPTAHFDAIISQSPETRAGDSNAVTLQITPSSQHPVRASVASRPLVLPEKCDEQITPACLRALYVLMYEPFASHNNSYAIGEYFTVFLLAHVTNTRHRCDLEHNQRCASHCWKSPIGFNPTIYSVKFEDVFNNITTGTNQGREPMVSVPRRDRGGGWSVSCNISSYKTVC